MALSKLTAIRLDSAFGIKANSNAFQAAVVARVAPSKKLAAAIVVALAANKSSAEIIAAISSGVTLTLAAKRRCLIAMGGDVAGNELINFIQSSATKAIKL